MKKIIDKIKVRFGLIPDPQEKNDRCLILIGENKTCITQGNQRVWVDNETIKQLVEFK